MNKSLIARLRRIADNETSQYGHSIGLNDERFIRYVVDECAKFIPDDVTKHKMYKHFRII